MIKERNKINKKITFLRNIHSIRRDRVKVAGELIYCDEWHKVSVELCFYVGTIELFHRRSIFFMEILKKYGFFRVNGGSLLQKSRI